MIYDHIDNRNTYGGLTHISQALTYLAGLNPDNPPKEKTSLDGDNLIANPLSYRTKSAEECVFEAHRTYIDIHFCISGEETISIASPEKSKETKAYSAENDTVYFDGAAASRNVMRPGDFLVCFPQDIHLTGEAVGAPCDVRKIVMKVKVR